MASLSAAAPTPPDPDPGQTIRLAPRSQRRTLLQLPLGHTLSPR